MTELSNLLARLKELDGATWRNWYAVALACFGPNEVFVPDNILSLDILQGTIQRACEKRGWYWDISNEVFDDEPYWAYIYNENSDTMVKDVTGQTAVEALLRAYLAALEGES